jgi:cellulose synthase/poly-beta-1,6-N-acetylglucosamine synthase-like glycosyltransferase
MRPLSYESNLLEGRCRQTEVVSSLLLVVALFLYVLQNIISALSVYTMLLPSQTEVWIKPCCFNETGRRLAVIVPLYKENSSEIAKTFSSICMQDYPKGLLRVLVVVEDGDVGTMEAVEENLGLLSASGIRSELVVKPPPRSCKASALNFCLKGVEEDVIAVYDGGDELQDANQFRAAVELLEEGYSAVGVRVLRGGKDLLSRFSLVEYKLWYDVALPMAVRLTGYPLLSGEGMFLRREFLRAVGGFKEVLTEDSYMTIMMMAKLGIRAALLESVVLEGAPKGWGALVKQRVRWYKGYSQCAKGLLRTKITLKVRLPLLIIYLSPLALIAITLSIMTVFIASLSFFGLGVAISPGFLWWSCGTAIATLTATMYVCTNYSTNLLVAILLPVYWMVMGLVSLYAMLTPRVSWYKTSRV